MRHCMLTLAALLTVFPLAAGQDVLRGGDKPTYSEIQTAHDIMRRAKAEPIILASGGYAFIELDAPSKNKWYVVPGGTGEIKRQLMPKGSTYEGFLVPKGETAFKWTEIAGADKDRVRVTGVKEGPVTLLRIANGKTAEDEPDVVAAYHFIVGPQPAPPVVIPPVVVPPVVVPPDTPITEILGFTSLAIAELAKLPATARPLASSLADNFEAVSAKLAASSAMTIDDAMAQLTEKNRATLGANRAAWLPWFTAWAAKADQHNAAGTMATPADYVTAFTETATGLRKAK